MKSWLEKITQKRIQHIMKESILLLKDSLEPYKISQIHDFSTKNVYIDKLYDIVNKYNNKYHNAIKMKLVELM